MIRGSDGLDYEDLTARLLGEPAKTRLNRFLLDHTRDEEVCGWYVETYDYWQARGYDDETCNRAAIAQVDRNLDAQRAERIRKANQLSGDRTDALRYAVLAGYLPKCAMPESFGTITPNVF